ncbi:MAG: ABC transporter permease [Chloroflexota bacterium]
MDNSTDKTREQKRGFLANIAVRAGKGEAILLPVLSVLTALVVGAFIIPFSDPDVLAARGFAEILRASWISVRDAYSAMFIGAFGDPKLIGAAIRTWQATGETKDLLDAFRPASESLTIATPYIFAGLGVALGFRGGLFNIGAEGQLFAAGLATAFVGYSITGLPAFIHLPLAMLAGAAAGALWGGIPGFLKARTGAHEVINTIMMNYIAFRLTEYLLSGPMQRPDGLPITPEVRPTSYLPLLFESPMRIHWGFLIALALAFAVYWFLWKTPLGLEIRMVGANPNASRYAGIRITVITVLTMVLSGALAGMAGVGQILGVDHKLVRAFSSGYGFDAISLALLGNSHPFGVVLASLLFGFLRGGAARMQSVAGTPVELIRIIQGLVIIFVAAPEIIRTIYRINRGRRQKSAS